MKTITLPYGRGKIDLKVSEERLVAELYGKLNSYVPEKSEKEILEGALENPIESVRLCELAKNCKNAVVITSDHTRPIPSKKTMPLLLKELRKFNPNIDITILIATGLHRDTTRDELLDHFGEEIFNNEKIVIHHCDDADNLVEIGVHENGTVVEINKLAYETDLLVAEGVLESHFFAGFSGGRKSVLPGISSRRTVMENHCSENLASPNAIPGVMENNPISDEMFFAAEKAKLKFIYNVILDSHKNIVGAIAGHPVKAHAEGVKFLSDLCFEKPQYADIVFATNGGYPLDQNIYQSVKGMLSASYTCRDGGVIVMCAKCEDGDGGKSFLKMFEDTKDADELYDIIMSRGRKETVRDQWQAQVLCEILKKQHVIMVTEAPKEQIEIFGMHYAKSTDEALKLAEELLGNKNATVTALPDAPSVIIKK